MNWTQAYRPWVCRMCHGTPRFWQISWPYFNQGDRLCPPNYYWHTRIFRRSDGPESDQFYVKSWQFMIKHVQTVNFIVMKITVQIKNIILIKIKHMYKIWKKHQIEVISKLTKLWISSHHRTKVGQRAERRCPRVKRVCFDRETTVKERQIF